MKKKNKKEKVYWIYDYELASAYDQNNKKLFSLLESGLIDYLQLRCKNNNLTTWVQTLTPKIKEYSTTLIINDDVILAKKVEADGVHLGDDDCSPQKARKILGDDKIIGVTARELELISNLQNAPINYLGIGTIFATTTKQNLIAKGTKFIKKISLINQLDFFPIGGINSTNITELRKLGIQQVALASCLFKANDSLAELKKIRSLLR